MKIDAGVYFWKYGKTIQNPIIRNNRLMQQNYLPEQFSQTLRRNGMDGCVAVLAEPTEVETRFLSELAITHTEDIKGVVGWLDLYDPKATEKIQEFHRYGSIRGYSTQILTAHKISSAVMELFLEFQYSLDFSLANDSSVSELDKWLQTNPDQQFVLDEAGNPDTKQPPSKTWETNIRELSKNKNLSCKTSGLLERSDRKSWKPGDFYPFLEILFDAFGPERLLFSSNWPYLLLAGIYVQWKSLLEKFTEDFSDEDRDKFFGGNASKIYRL